MRALAFGMAGFGSGAPGSGAARLRRLLLLVWPSSPTSWREVPSLLRPQAVQIARLTVAAVVAYVAAELVTPGTLDLTAPLTALLVVQASTVGTLQMGIARCSPASSSRSGCPPGSV
jgi:hypothetical protein